MAKSWEQIVLGTQAGLGHFTIKKHVSPQIENAQGNTLYHS